MSRSHKSVFTAKDVDLIAKRTVYEGYGRVEEFTLRHRLYDGGWTDPITRELFKSGDAVVVLPYDPVHDTLVMVEQFRISAYDRGIAPWTVECIAGRISPGETPEEVAIREAHEESGCRISDLIKIGDMFASPGIFAEYVHIFCARTNAENITGIHGLAGEHEDIRPLVFRFDDALADLERGRFVAAPVFICLHWLARHRAALRERWGAAS